MNVLLSVVDVSISYKLGDFKDIGLKEWTMRHLTHNYHVQNFLAVNGVSFELSKGDMLGIIGANGAGKSTLLKSVAGIMEPTKGHIVRNGSVSALLELASGFDGDLTIKENAYLRGAMLGYTRAFMDSTYDRIISFAELEAFQDRPFKQLSSGMQSRLAFSIASLVQPEILILDEVLSVGDGAFQEKSAKKMREIIDSGAATILVTHSLSQIRNLCTKVLWLDHGKQVTCGKTQEVCDRYEAFLKGDETALEDSWRFIYPELESEPELELESEPESAPGPELELEPEPTPELESEPKPELEAAAEEPSNLEVMDDYPRICPICGKKARYFEPYGEKKRPDAMCPSCRSVERHRAYYLFFTRETDILSPQRSIKLLHFAPESCLMKFFCSTEMMDYYPVDYNPAYPGIRETVDITDILYKNDMFDYIICNHVLEHIENDKSALMELYRVLKPSGKAFINVFVDAELKHTLERAEYDTPELRSKYYGQSDHMRQYGNDFKGILTSAGFLVSEIFNEEYFTDEEIKKFGLLRVERIYICEK